MTFSDFPVKQLAISSFHVSIRLDAPPRPCHCEIDSKHWARSRRTRPRCVFIDLGAGTGGDLEAWVANRFGPVANCPSGEWAAILVEANPLFAATLSALAGRFHGQAQAPWGSRGARARCR